MTKPNVALLLCLVLLIVGCKKSSEERAVERQIEKATGEKADVDISEKGVRITGKSEGEEFTITAGERTEIPEDFPSDVFVYQPSKAVMAMKIPEGHTLTLQTTDDRSKVVRTYREGMKARGWSEKAVMEMDHQTVLVYEKKDRTASINIGARGGVSQITAAVTTKLRDKDLAR